MKHLFLIFLSLILLFCFIYYQNSVNNFTYTIGPDGERYRTHGVVPNLLVANKMAMLNSQALKLLRHIHNHKKNDGEFAKLLSRYNYQKMVENSPHNWSDDTSYMENKGKVFALQVAKKDGKMYSNEILIFILLHEMAHLMIDEYGHPFKFWVSFKKLLIEANKIGVYNEVVDYQKSPSEYGGMIVGYNPFYDERL